jgi:hypothetical protein
MLEAYVVNFVLNIMGSAAIASTFIVGIMAIQGSRLLTGMTD